MSDIYYEIKIINDLHIIKCDQSCCRLEYKQSSVASVVLPVVQVLEVVPVLVVSIQFQCYPIYSLLSFNTTFLILSDTLFYASSVKNFWHSLSSDEKVAQKTCEKKEKGIACLEDERHFLNIENAIFR